MTTQAPKRPGRARAAVVLLLAIAAIAAIVVPATSQDPFDPPVPFDALLGGLAPPRACDGVDRGPFGSGHWPSACWRPYAADSAFNRPLGPNPRVAADSDRVVQRLLGFGRIQNLLAGEAADPGGTDYSHPTYWSQPNDPYFTLHCTENWGRCPIEGMRIQIPDRAIVPSGSDHHITVIDQLTGWEYDFWGVSDKPRGGGTLTFRFGGRTALYGDGLNSDANAARFGELAGNIRAEELEAGRIDHALFLGVHCDSGRFVFPATKTGLSCAEIGEPNEGAPPMGTRFQLDMTPREIDALPVPGWKKTILRAMARYGMFVGDTGGSWGLKTEGGDTYVSFGYADRWAAFARRQHVPYSKRDRRWVFDLHSDVDWRRLRVIDQCEAEGSCQRRARPASRPARASSGEERARRTSGETLSAKRRSSSP